MRLFTLQIFLFIAFFCVNSSQSFDIDDDAHLQSELEPPSLPYSYPQRKGDSDTDGASGETKNELEKRQTDKPGYFNHIVAPVKLYVNLINRFRIWYATKGSKLPDLAATLRLKYARVDDELSKELCSKNENLNEESLSDKDFVFEVLRRLVDQLEKDSGDLNEPTDVLETSDLPSVDTEHEKERLDQERITAAMDRLKRTGSSIVYSILKSESRALVELAGWHAASIALSSFEGLPPTLAYVLTFCIGSAETPFVAKYLSSLARRAIMIAAGPFNLLKYTRCKTPIDSIKEE